VKHDPRIETPRVCLPKEKKAEVGWNRPKDFDNGLGMPIFLFETTNGK
jgi:hypothetical protein